MTNREWTHVTPWRTEDIHRSSHCQQSVLSKETSCLGPNAQKTAVNIRTRLWDRPWAQVPSHSADGGQPEAAQQKTSWKAEHSLYWAQGEGLCFSVCFLAIAATKVVSLQHLKCLAENCLQHLALCAEITCCNESLYFIEKSRHFAGTDLFCSNTGCFLALTGYRDAAQVCSLLQVEHLKGVN